MKIGSLVKITHSVMRKHIGTFGIVMSVSSHSSDCLTIKRLLDGSVADYHFTRLELIA